jgi:hypothetical protein
MRAQLTSLAARVSARVHPVFSNFGEPVLAPAQLANRSPHRWVICGGTALVERSGRSFREIANHIPENFSSHELFVLGGKENAATRALLGDLPNVRVEYRPQIDAGHASQILSSCAFAWLDYFHRTDVPMDIVLKSSAFAAVSAHGVIPVFPHTGSAVSIENDRLPGPFFLGSNSMRLPAGEHQARVATEFYNWYQRHGASEHLVHGIANALDLTANQ